MAIIRYLILLHREPCGGYDLLPIKLFTKTKANVNCQTIENTTYGLSSIDDRTSLDNCT